MKRLYGVLPVVLIIGFLGFKCLRIVETGYQGVKINKFNGNYQLVNKQGFKFINPFTEMMVLYRVKETTLKLDDVANTKDNVQLTYVSNATYKVSDGRKLYSKRFKIDEEDLQIPLETALTKALDQVSNKYTYDYIKSNIAGIGDEVSLQASKNLKEYGIEVVSYDIVGIKAPRSIEDAINQKIKLQQEAEATKYQVEKAENFVEASRLKETEISFDQQRLNLCELAIESGQANSPACYFGNGTYVNGGTGVVGTE